VPTYEYACTTCGHRFDAVQRFTDEALTECPECDGPLRKVYGAVGIVLKGSGFYKTDSRAAAANGSNGKGSSRNESSAGESSGSPSDSGSTSGSSDKSEKSDKKDSSDKSGKSDKKDSKTTASAASTAG
jgi:putative FmdB family regulatory protein